MRNTSFLRFLLLFFVGVFLFASCDKEYNEVGEALIGDNHFDLLKDDTQTVASSWNKNGPIASNNLYMNALGILDNSAFGKTTANFATQVELAALSPVIDPALNQQVKSVVLYVPYFTNAAVTTNTDGSHVYTLDSIYGNKTAKIKLSVYENKQLLGSLNTEPGAPLLDPSYPQLYYTNQNADFDGVKGTWLNDSSVDNTQNSQFVFSPNEYKIVNPPVGTAAATTTYIAPGMKLDLNTDFFQKLFFGPDSNPSFNFLSNDNFKQYFKGLYFNVEKIDDNVLAMMVFNKGTITVNYTENTSSTDATPVDRSIVLNLTGNTVNLLTNDFSSSGIEYSSSPKSDRIYLRGGEGSTGVIDLFNAAVDVVTYSRTTNKIESGSNNIPDELDYIKANGWLINDASLTFYIDQDAMSGVTEPNRIFVYDIYNGTTLLDYGYDSTGSSSPNYQKRVFGGIIEKDASGRGVRYKVSITNYLRSLLKNDYNNVKLGVSVTQAIMDPYFKKIKNSPLYADWQKLSTIQKNAYYFPEASVMSPLGTVLYGSNATPVEKRMKLEIYYTKQKSN